MSNPYLTKADIMKGDKHLKKIMDKQIKRVMSHLGAKGKGKSKVRGDSAYYKNLTAIRESKRKEDDKYQIKNVVKVMTIPPRPITSPKKG